MLGAMLIGNQIGEKPVREAREVCKTRPLVFEKVGIQRLTLLQPVDLNVPTGEE